MILEAARQQGAHWMHGGKFHARVPGSRAALCGILTEPKPTGRFADIARDRQCHCCFGWAYNITIDAA